MRLRPSGRQGPVATSLAAFKAYQRDEAWTWEHLALTRARPIAGAAPVMAVVEDFRKRLLAEKADAVTVLSDMAAMQARLREAKPTSNPWESKHGTGRLQDIELLGQAMALIAADPATALVDQLLAGARTGLINRDALDRLMEAQAIFWQLRMAEKLLSDKALDMDAVGTGGRNFILRECGADGLDKLAGALEQISSEVAAIIASVVATEGVAE